MRVATLLMLASVLALAIYAPHVSAHDTHPAAYSALGTAQQTRASQLTAGTASGFGCSNGAQVWSSSGSYALTSGASYFVAYAISQGAPTVTVTGSSSGKYWDDNMVGTLSNVRAGTSAAVVHYKGAAPFVSVVHFTAVANEGLTFTCAGTGTPGFNRYWNGGGNQLSALSLSGLLNRDWQYPGCGGGDVCFTTMALFSDPGPDASAPTAPQNFNAVGDISDIDLLWSAPASNGGATITAYKIYRDCGESMCLLATIGTNTSFSDATVAPGVLRAYSVSAVNSAGEGPTSSQDTAMAGTVPGAVQSFSATAGYRQVALSWTATGSPGSPSFTGHRIYRDCGESMCLLATIGTNTSFVDMQSGYGTTRAYSVGAYNPLGESDSGQQTALPYSEPAAPVLSGSATVAGAALSWTTPANNGLPITAYKIYRDCGESMCLLATIGTNTSFTDYQIAYGVSRAYSVAAVNGAGEGSASNQVTLTPISAGAPQAFSVEARYLHAALSWSAPADGAPVSGYRVYRNGSQLAILGARTTTYYDYVPAPCVSYSYYVVAFTGYGDGPATATINATPWAYPDVPLFGEDGAIYGAGAERCGSITGGKQELAASLKISSLAYDLLLGLVMTVGLAITGSGAGASVGGATLAAPGAIVGAIGGAALSIAFGFFPAWVVLFLAIVGAALFLVFRGRSG